MGKVIERVKITNLLDPENFDVLAETEGSQPLIGQVPLEILDLVVDPKSHTLSPNPQSPEMPLLEIL